VAAQIGNNRANAGKLLDERSPEIAVERSRMQENYRWARACVGESQA
jgi:hypothetical protein